MKKNSYKSISETDYLSDEQLCSIEMSGCSESCKQGCSSTNHSGQFATLSSDRVERVEEKTELLRVN